MSAEASRRWRDRRRAAGLPIHSARQMEKSRAWLAETYRNLRAMLYEIVGKQCVGCGHDDIRVLEFDHVHGDGAEDRRKFQGARSMLEFYVAHPAIAKRALQTMCRNCNWLKRKGNPLPNASRLLDGRTHDEFPQVRL